MKIVFAKFRIVFAFFLLNSFSWKKVCKIENTNENFRFFPVKVFFRWKPYQCPGLLFSCLGKGWEWNVQFVKLWLMMDVIHEHRNKYHARRHSWRIFANTGDRRDRILEAINQSINQWFILQGNRNSFPSLGV